MTPDPTTPGSTQPDSTTPEPAAEPVGSVRPRLVLVGPPGAGKTSVGALLARRWGVAFRDTDADVEASAGKPVAEIFFDEGEGRFRELEAAAVRAVLAAHPGVASLGGGAVMAPGTRELLTGHRVVFLDVGLGEASSRVGLGVTRPLLMGNVRSRLKSLLDARRPLYESVATLTVRTDALDVEAVADEIERRLDD